MLEVYEGNEPVGLVDVIDGYRRPGAALIGLLAIAESWHLRELGRRTYELVEKFARRT